MPILPILHYPDPRLATIAQAVAKVDGSIQQLVSDMFETMYAANGIGLAATQIDRHVRVVVIDISEERNQPLTLINPEIIWLSDEIEKGREGCLSVPEIYDEVPRAQALTLRARNTDGQDFQLQAQGLLAICVQHELDHLNGKVFVQYLSRLKQDRIRTKLRKNTNVNSHTENWVGFLRILYFL